MRRHWLGSAVLFVLAGGAAIGASGTYHALPFFFDTNDYLYVNNQGAGSGTSSPAYTRIQDSSGTISASVTTQQSDGLGNQWSLATTAFGFGFNGVSWDRLHARNGEQQITSGGSTLTKVTATTCTSASPSAVTVHKVWSAAGSETATVSIYNEGASPTCAAADLVWSGVPSNTSPVTLDASLGTGFAYKLSGAAVNNDYVSTN